jgi:hypothetical protein
LLHNVVVGILAALGLDGLEDERQIPPLRCGTTTRKAMTARRAIATDRIDQSLESDCNWLSLFSNKGKNDGPETFSLLDRGLSSCCAYRDGCADWR